MRERTVHVDGPINVLEVPGPPDGPTFVCVHGLGGHHASFLSIARLLSARGRVLALDLPGSGRSPLAGRRTSMSALRLALDRFCEAMDATPAILVGNSMGGALSIMQAAMRPEAVAGLVLISPAVPRPITAPLERRLALTFGTSVIPGVGELAYRRRLARLGPEEHAAALLELCTVDPRRVPDEIIESGLAIARERRGMDDAAAAFLQATRSLVGLLARRSAFARMVARVEAPTLILAGRQDRLVPLVAIQALAAARPDWRLEILDDVGHIAMAEVPDRTMALIEGWLDAGTAETPGVAPGVSG